MNNASETPYVNIRVRDVNNNWFGHVIPEVFRVGVRYYISLSYTGTTLRTRYLSPVGEQFSYDDEVVLRDSKINNGPTGGMIAGDPRWANGSGSVTYHMDIDMKDINTKFK